MSDYGLSFWVDWLQAAVRMAAPLVIASIGAVYCERSGVFNIGIEGMMLTGAFGGVIGSLYTGSAVVGVIVGILVGVALGAVLALLGITLRTDQIVAGLTINLFALGLTSYLFKLLFDGATQVTGFEAVPIPGLSKIPVIGPILFDQIIPIYLVYLAVPASAWILFRTTWGLQVRATGEYPKSVDTAGLSVLRTRYVCVLIGGAFAGLAGAILALGQLRYFVDNMTGGRGFIVIAALIFGRWHPVYAAAACFLFAAADAFQLRAQALGMNIPYQFLLMLPYVLTLFAIGGLMGRSRPPAAIGLPYDREENN